MLHSRLEKCCPELAAPELASPYREAAHICAAALQSGHLSENSLTRLLESARSARTVLGEGVAGMLSLLVHRFPSVRDGVRAMARDKKAHIRINALLALDAAEENSLNGEILAAALHDRSAKVRCLAADRIRAFGLGCLAVRTLQ